MGDFEPNPVTWHTLARHSVAVRGPSPDELEIWTDPTMLASWTRGNLQGYWQPWLEQAAQLFSSQPEKMTSYGEWASAWGGLGVTRLHYTLRTGEITSKEGAGLYALETFPAKWHQVVNECLRIRRGERVPSLYSTPIDRWHDVFDYMGMVLADVHELKLGHGATLDS